MGLREEAARLRAEAEKLERRAEEEERGAIGTLRDAHEVACAMVTGKCYPGTRDFEVVIAAPECDLYLDTTEVMDDDDLGELADSAVEAIADLIEHSREEGRQELIAEMRERLESAEHPDDVLGWVERKLRSGEKR